MGNLQFPLVGTEKSDRARRCMMLLVLLAAICGPIDAFQPSLNLRLISQRRSHVLYDRLPKIIDVEAEVATKGTSEDQVLLTEGADQQTFQLNDSDTRTKYIMLGLLWITACLSALDRVAMSVALVPMSAELGYTDTIKGSISSLLSIGYGLFILPVGLLVGIISPRIVMIFGIALWSVATFATPIAAGIVLAGMTPLLLARACVGAGESIVLPTTQRFLAVWTAPDEKSRGKALSF
jgi:hypothetical protein